MATTDSIILLGLNPAAGHEADELRRLGNHVIFMSNTRTQDEVRHGKRRYNLADSHDAESFVAHLGLSAIQAKALVKLIADVGNHSRDELGKLAA